jgi:hypothetical protein
MIFLLNYNHEWPQKEGIVAVPHRHQAKEMELTQIRINSSPTRKYGVSLIQD